MKPPPMCPECERNVARVYLRDGAAAAVLVHGDKPCPHVFEAFGFKFIPDESCPDGQLRQHFAHPLVAAAYR